jgi:DNA-binding ferritin-like protein (Dps family)
MSRPPGPTQHDPFSPVVPSRTPGSLGCRDAAEPNCRAALGDTPGPLGVNDRGHFPGSVLLAEASPPDPAAKKTAGGVEMYAPGESSTFDKLKQDVENLGIRYAFAAVAKTPTSTRATYDPVTNTVRISRESYDKYLKNIEKDELRRDIAHELVHARQRKELLQNAHDPETRRQLIDKEALSMSEEQYVKFRWNNEIQAERTAWDVFNESLDSFEAKRKGKRFPRDFLKEVTDTRIQEFTDQTKADYEKDFRATYKRSLAASR